MIPRLLILLLVFILGCKKNNEGNCTCIQKKNDCKDCFFDGFSMSNNEWHLYGQIHTSIQSVLQNNKLSFDTIPQYFEISSSEALCSVKNTWCCMKPINIETTSDISFQLFFKDQEKLNFGLNVYGNFFQVQSVLHGDFESNDMKLLIPLSFIKGISSETYFKKTSR